MGDLMGVNNVFLFLGTLQQKGMIAKYGRTYEEEAVRDWDNHGTKVASVINAKGPDCIIFYNYKVGYLTMRYFLP